jgi:hypothetical protein
MAEATVNNPQFSYEEPQAQPTTAPAAPTAATAPAATTTPAAKPAASAAPAAKPASFSYEEPPSTLQKVGKFALDSASNFGAGAIQTAEGLGDIGHKAIHAVLPESAAEVLSPNVGMAAEHSYAKPLTDPVGSKASQIAGYGGESLMEFLTGDEALKGLSLGDKLMKSAKIAKILETSPRLMEALQHGAKLKKLAQQYPRIAELLGSSARAGAVQGTQTTVKTGGDVKEGAKEGAVMGVSSAALGAPFSAASSLLSKAGAAKNTLNKLTEAGANAPEKSDAVKAVRGWINDAEQKMHGDFESGVQSLRDQLKGETIKPEESALSKKAQELLQNVPGEGPKLARELQGQMKGIVPGTERTEGLLERLAKPHSEEETTMAPKDFLRESGSNRRSVLATPQDEETVKSLADAYSKGEEVPTATMLKDGEGNLLEVDGRHRALAAHQAGKATIPVKVTTKMSDFDVDGLVDLRQKLGAKARELPYGDPNARRLRQLQHAIDDDIGTMAKNADKPEVAEQYSKLRSDYRSKLADIQSTPIDKLRTDEPGKELNDVGQYILSGGNSKAKIEALRKVIGPDRMGTIADSVATNWLRDATSEAGKFDPQKFLNQYSKVKPEVRNTLFNGRPAVKLTDFVNDAASARLVQQAVKAGILTVGGGTLGGGAGAMLGLVLGSGDTAASHVAGRGLLDYLVNHPATWGALKLGEKATGKAAQVAPKVAAIAGSAMTPALRTVYAGSQDSLGGGR